jgi:23S rRNA (cytidine1920-2'-O)/16S rRNA (cytidine1409-2'-O)-methyltransferase
MSKRRIDTILVERGLYETREQAQRAILAGEVLVGTRRVAKCAEMLAAADENEIVVRARDHAVSRGYYKLQKAFEVFALSADGRTALDVGSSTGGFTQFLLEHGARLVYAVDCGTNQLAYSLRRDARVLALEKTNARYLTQDMLARAYQAHARKAADCDPDGEPPVPDLAVMDVSFISATLILPQLAREFPLAEIVLLIKPQFEAGRQDIAKGGIVRTPLVHERVIARVESCARDIGFPMCALTYSPIQGSEGNIEFLAFLRKNISVPEMRMHVVDEAAIRRVVAEAHAHFLQKTILATKKAE